jgi:hypothetical protein
MKAAAVFYERVWALGEKILYTPNFWALGENLTYTPKIER